MNFDDTMQSNPPRLVVMWRIAEDGGEQYHWGISGKSVPILSLIGSIVESQFDIVNGEWIQECTNEQPAFVLAFDAVERSFSHFKHPDIPNESLVGMLEVIKQILVASRLAQQTAGVSILGPDGKVMSN